MPRRAPAANGARSVAAMLAPLANFVGREHELGEVQRLLGGARLLTLTGTGGIGKTRLALQVAGAARPAFADGMVFVDLAPLGDPALVPQALAATIGLPGHAGRLLLDTPVDDLRPSRRCWCWTTASTCSGHARSWPTTF